jgi:lysophospholipase L1-like esterase
MKYKLDRLPIITARTGIWIKRYDSDNSNLVDYKFNDYGYRASFDYEQLLDEKKIVCIGCSFTEGVGLDEKETWPYLLSQQLGLPYLNLGVAGGSQGYVMWQIMNVLKNIQNDNIFVLSPPTGRFFKLTDTEFENKQSWDVETATETYSNFYDLNDFMLESICKAYNINYLNCMDFGIDWKLAKDGQHFGIEYQQEIVKQYTLCQKESIYQP